MDFSSDTAAPAHPKVLQAVLRANAGMAPSYGADEWTRALQEAVGDVFETEVRVLPVVSGTAANALGLSLICRPDEAIICHRESHIERDERGAPEFYTGGGKLSLVDGAHGKMDPARIQQICTSLDRNFFHETPAAAISFTNLTESGAAYTVKEIEEICSPSRSAGLRVHQDGARFGNAVAHLKEAPATLSWSTGTDILSLGLTKGGAAGCEVICLFGEMIDRFPELQARAKRGGHMPPKMRFMAAQGIAMLTDNLWIELAHRANDTAAALSKFLVEAYDAELVSPVDGNEVFAILPPTVQANLFSLGLKAYPWSDGSVRFVCHWNSAAELEALRNCNA